METAVSSDGTRIAYWQCGSGPCLVLVHGTSANHTRWASISPRFEEHFTVVAVDRRGRGESGDQTEYTIGREFEDIAAVVDALDAPILLFGHSYGAMCALEAALLTSRVTGLILYEPPHVVDNETLYAPGQLDRLDALLAAGDRDGMVSAFFTEVVGVPQEQMTIVKSSPAWPGRVAAAHTIVRECRAEESYRLPLDRLSRLSIPVLLLLGGDSPPFFGKVRGVLEGVLPNIRTVVMSGQGHMAMDTAPDLVVKAVLGFWRDIA
jgi:pimeloyl-ACP methyl ester carboxylesterase